MDKHEHRENHYGATRLGLSRLLKGSMMMVLGLPSVGFKPTTFHWPARCFFTTVPHHLQLWWLNKRNALEIVIKHKGVFLKSPTAVAFTGK